MMYRHAHPHLKFYEDQLKKREEMMKNNEVFLINKNLKELLQKAQAYINREDYQKDVRELSRYLAYTSLWEITYRNNMENPKVALSQGILINRILQRDGDKIPKVDYIKYQLERFMHQLGNIDWSLYINYNQSTKRMY